MARRGLSDDSEPVNISSNFFHLPVAQYSSFYKQNIMAKF